MALRIRSHDGQSRMDDHEIALAPRDKYGLFSDPLSTTGVFFRETAADYDSGWHVAPSPLYLVILDGEVEVEVSGGERRRVAAGGVILAEDLDGEGHRTRAVGDKPVRSLVIYLAKS